MRAVNVVLLVFAGAMAGAMLMKVVQYPLHFAAKSAVSPAAYVPAPRPAVAETPAAIAQAPAVIAQAPATIAQAPVAIAKAPSEPIKPASTAATLASRVHKAPLIAESTPAAEHSSVDFPIAPPQTPAHLTARRHDESAPQASRHAERVIEKRPSAAPLRHSQPRVLSMQSLDFSTPAVPTPSAAASTEPSSPPVLPEQPKETPPARSEPENVTPPPTPSAPQPNQATLNAGMLLPVRLLAALSPERNHVGDVFAATLYRELVASGFVVAERGARVEGRVTAIDANTGAISLELTSVHTSDNQDVSVQTDRFDVTGALDASAARRTSALRADTRLTFRMRAPVIITERAQ
ncbi:MAG TPA: hypothetical protein VHW24_05990 [Bryobacteraceae bacterium]|nr:hypothetical protein [Bryobacteraceae bacterium]